MRARNCENLFVIDQAFPLELKVPNAETLAAMAESRAIIAASRARFATADELFADLDQHSGANGEQGE